MTKPTYILIRESSNESGYTAHSFPTETSAYKAMDCMDGWDGTQRFQDIDRLEGTGTLNARDEGMSYYDAPTSGVSLKYPVATGDTVLV